MKKNIITLIKIIIGIISILISFKVLVFLSNDIIYIHEYYLLKWFALLICALGFYISGLINRKTPLKFIPLLYVSLLLFIPMRFFYFPLYFFLILFASISLLVTRKEINRKYRLSSLLLMTALFAYFLFSQPLVIRQGKEISYVNGELQNSNVVWNFTGEIDNTLPKDIFLNSNNEEIDLSTFKNKTIYITFWATWCKPCMKEKPELEKLKDKFKGNTDIVFIDISLDVDKTRWKHYLIKNKPKGVQLITKNEGKTRALYAISGVPEHILVNSKGEFRKGIEIHETFTILSDSSNIDSFINRKKQSVLKNYTNARIIKKVKLENTERDFYTTDGKNRLSGSEMNNLLAKYREVEKPMFVYLAIEDTIQVNDSLIHQVHFAVRNEELQIEE